MKSIMLFLLIGCTFTLNLFGEGTREILVNTTVVSNGQQFDTTKSTYTAGAPTGPANVFQIWDQGPSPGGLGRATGTYTSIAPANEKFRIKIRACKVGEVINIGFRPHNNAVLYWRLYKQDGTSIRFNGTGGNTNLSAIAGVETVAGTTFTYKVPTTAEATQPGFIQYYSQAAVGPAPTCSTTTAVGELGVGYPIRTYCGYTSIQYVVTAADMAMAGAGGFVDFFIVFNGGHPTNEQKNTNVLLTMFDVTVWDNATSTPRITRKARLFSSAWDINCNGNGDPAHTFNSKLYFYSKDSVITAVTFNRMRPWGFILCANSTGTANTGVNDFDRRSRIQFNGAPDYPVFLNNPFPAAVADRTCGITPKSSFGNILGASITGCDDDRCINILADKTGTVGITLLPVTPGTFVPRVFNNSTLIGNVSTCVPWDGLDGAGNPITTAVNVQINYFNGLTNLPLYDVEDHPFGYIIELIAPPPTVPVAPATVSPILVYWDDRPPAGTGVVTDIIQGSARDGLWDSDNNPLTADIPVGYHDFDPVNAFQSHSTYNLTGCDPSVDHSAATAGRQSCHLWTGRGDNMPCPGTATGNCAETHNTWWNANVVNITIPFTVSNVKVFADIDAAPAPVGTGNASARTKNVCSTLNPIPINGVIRRDANITSVADANDISDDVPFTGQWQLVPGFASGSLQLPASNLVNSYNVAAADLLRGFILLRIVSDVNAALVPCGFADDTLRVNIVQGPDLWARQNVTVCANNALVALDPGIVGDSSGKNNVVSTFRWTPFVGTTPLVGGTFVPNNQSFGLTATYTPPASFTSGTIIMRVKSLTTTVPAGVNCPADSAQFNIVVNSVPLVNALDTLKICRATIGTPTTAPIPAGQATINGGSSLTGFTVNWTSPGGGSFTGNGTLTPTYTPTATELALGVAKVVFNVTKTSAPSCAPVRDTLIIGFRARPTANAGSAFSICRNNAATIPLRGVATNFSTVAWTAAPATGSFAPTNNDTTVFTPSGVLPASYTFTLQANPVAGSPCPAATSPVVVTFTNPPAISTPATLNYCIDNPSVAISATVPAGVSGEWYGNSAGTTKPAGTLSPSDDVPNVTYTLAPGEVGGPVALFYFADAVGNCLRVSDTIVLFPAPTPTLNVPASFSLCSNVSTITLSGSFISGAFDATTVLWSTLGTGGTFDNTNAENPVYTPSVSDRGNGSVKLVLSVKGIAPPNCAAVTDTVTILFTPAPTANAGSDHNVCSNNPTVNIAGTVTPAATAGHTWSYVSGPAGTFGNAGNLSTSFTATGTPTPTDTTRVRLTATLPGCNPVSSITNIIYTAPPTATITTATGTSVCANNAVITIKGGTSTGVGTWVSSSGCTACFQNANKVGILPAVDSTIYTPSLTDIANGSVTFTLQTISGSCNTVTSSGVAVTISPAPTVTISPIAAVCETSAAMTLSATSTTGSGTWTSSSGCVSCFVLNGPSNLTGTYNPSVNDINNGTVTFTFTSANSGNCVPVQATRAATINRAPVITAGPDLTVCTNQNTIALTGSTSSNTTSVAWSIKPGSGTGSITNPSSLNGAVYNISATDKTNGTVILVLTGNGVAGCGAVTQERVILFTDIATASVGPNQTLCQNDAQPAILDASGSTGGTWTCPTCLAGISNNTSLTAQYTPAAGDIGQTRAFTYAIPASGACPGVSATKNITFNPAPVVTITTPLTHCGNSMTISLAGTFTNATGLFWTSDGTGTFSNQTGTTTDYTISSADTVGTNSTIVFTLISTGSGSASAPCSADTATATVTITDPIVLFAGADRNLCGAPGTSIPLAPVVLTGGSASVTWSIVGASTGILTPAPPFGATYQVGAGDAGTTIVFQASASAVGVCAAQIDQVSYSFVAPVTSSVTAPPAGFCQTGSVTLAGAITGTNAGIWSCTNCTGSGTFSPDHTYNNAIPQTSVTFTPAPADTSKLSLTFLLTSDTLNVCGGVASAPVIVAVEKKPRVGPFTIAPHCANNNVISLPNTPSLITHTNTGVWSVGMGKTTGFSASNTFPTALTYDPDTTEVQNGFVTLTLTSTAPLGSFCPSDSVKVTVTFTDAPVANAGLDRTICRNNPTFNLVGTINPGTGFVANWSSPNCGTPCFSAPNSLTTDYTLNAADAAGATPLMLFLTATDPSGLCSPDRDTVLVNLTMPPVVDITSTFPTPICSDSLFVNLVGTSTGGFNWSSTGTGNFQANAFQSAVVYPFTAADRAKANLPAPNNVIRITLSSDNGFCLPVSDFVDITLSPAPIVTITTGDSITQCANLNTVALAASVDQAGFNIDWKTSGNGSFSPDAPTTPAFNTTYTLTTLDKAAGSIVLTAETTNPPGNTCRAARKQYKVNIIPLPVVEAGAPYTVCQTVTSLDLSDASATNASSATWTTNGTGVFGLTNTTVGAGSVYYPSFLLASNNDVDKASITLTLTAVGCSTITDTRVINFTPKPTVDAGTPQTVCNEAASVTLTGAVTQASSFNWRVAGSATSFSSLLSPTYTLSAANKAAGFVDLVLTANGNGNCSPVTDTVRITIRPQPTLEIGPGASFCSKTLAEVLQYNFAAITLTNGITPTWTTTGTAANLDVFNPLQPTYTISNADIAVGSITIRATTRSHASCAIVDDAMTINITQAPTIDLGPPISICAATAQTIQLNSTFTHNSGNPSWISDNSGVFDNPNIVNPTYDPTTTEEAAGNVTTIFATINGQGSCPAATASVKITFTATPLLADLLDTVICFTSGVPFNYSVSTGIAGDWTTTSGAFLAPGGTAQQGVTLQATAVANGTITVTFDPNSVCYGAQTANALLTLVQAPTVTATSPLDVCVNNFAAAVNLTSTPANQGSVAWSTIQGFGSIGSASSANATYTLSADSSDFALDSILVKITVNSTNPACPSAVDTVAIRTHQAPLLSVSNQLVCSDIVGDAGAITLDGNTNGTGFTGTTWSSAQLSGITSPNALNTTATLNAFPATVTLTANGLHGSCSPVTAVLTITSQPAPTFTSAGLNLQACSNGDVVPLNPAAVTPSVAGGVWSKLQASAGGSFIPNNSGATGVSYSPSLADIALGNIDLIYTVTDTGVCYKGYADTINVLFNTPVKIQTTTPTFTFCAQDNNVSLTSTITPVVPISPPSGPVVTWTIESGVGVFTTSTNTLNSAYDPNPTNVPNGGDVANGGAILKVKLTNVTGCPDDSDLVSLLLVPEPAAIVNAGSTQQLCVDRVSAHLQGLILNADGGVWRTSKYGNVSVAAVAATGGFTDSLDLETDYLISNADRAKPSIRLYLYSRGGNSLCSQVIDSVDITFTPRPVPTATTSVPSVCADVDSINLTGSFSAGGINGIWSSSGDGYFTNIGVFDPTPVYVPGPTDIAVGSVVFTYSSNNFQDCQTYSDSDTTTITPKIEANAGPDLTVCGNNNTGITITASSPPTNTGIWSINGVFNTDYDGVFTQINPLQATYIPGDSLDPIAAAVSFKFVSTGGSPCKPDSSQMILEIAPAPTVRIATNTQTVCNDVSSINVNVTNITVATQGFWTSTGSGSFGNATALNTTYNFSASDLDSTNITIAFITTDNTSDGSLCNPAADAMVITLKPKPVVTAVPQYNCITPIGVTLDNSSVTYVDPGASGVWTTNSTAPQGQFSLDQVITSPGATVTSYFPSATDISRGTVTLTLTSAGAGTCAPVSRSVTLNVSTTPIADAGPDLFVCTSDSVALKATPFANLVQYDWTDLPAPGTLTIPSGLQTKTGVITTVTDIRLTVTDDRGCTNRDTVRVTPVGDPLMTQADQECYDFHGYVTVNVAGPTSPLGGYQWFYNGALMSGENRDSVRITQPGLYQVFYSLGACTQASDKATNVLDLPRILTPDYIGCHNSSVTATVQEIPNAQLSGLGEMPYNYSWTPGGATTNPAVLPTTVGNPPTIDTIIYNVTSSYTTPFVTCSYDDVVRVFSIPVPDPEIVDSIQVCEGQLVTLDANAPPSNLPALSQFPQTIEWYVASVPATILDNDAIFNPTSTNYYGVKVTIGQCIGGDTSKVDFRPYPTKTLASEIKQCFEQVGSVTLDAGPGSPGALGLTGTTYQWTSGAGDPALNTSNAQTTVITYPMIRDQDDEQILAFVSITNHFNALTCPVTDTILVRDVCVPRVFPPTAFHPGDGNPIDAEFTIKGKYLKNFKITVYSRWGEVIFYSEDANKHWDGTYRGDLMPVGVYAYIITYEGTDETTKGPFKKEGRIVLVR